MKKQKRVASSTAVTSILDFSDMPDNFPAVNGSIGVSATSAKSFSTGRFKPVKMTSWGSEVPWSGSHIDLRNMPADWFTVPPHFDVVLQKTKDA